MRRRDVLGLLGLVATWPWHARAQHPVPIIGYLTAGSPEDEAFGFDAFLEGLRQRGFVAGQNIAIERHQADRASELVARNIALFAAVGNQAALKAKAATSTVPIVFAIGGDPVALGLVNSLHQPSSNATGVSYLTTVSETKRLELLTQLVPGATTVAIFVNPESATTSAKLRELEAAARILGRDLHVEPVSSEAAIERGFSNIAGRSNLAVLIASDNFLNSKARSFARLASYHGIPIMAPYRQVAAAGGLAGYGPALEEGGRQIGDYAGRILLGEKPASLPVIQSAKIELVLNLATAKRLGLDLPTTLLARADEVIE